MKKKKKIEKVPCKYCGAKTSYQDEVCTNCRNKRAIMHGWHWLYKGKEIIKI